MENEFNLIIYWVSIKQLYVIYHNRFVLYCDNFSKIVLSMSKFVETYILRPF